MSRIDEALRRANQGSTFAPSAQEEREAPWIPPAALDRFERGGMDTSLVNFRTEEPDLQAEEPDILVREPEIRSEKPADVPLDLHVAPPAVRPELPPLLHEAGLGNEKLVGNGTVEPLAIEQYRKLAVTLHQMQVDRGTRTVMIASAMAGEGKTLTAANLALTLAESFKRRVLLIDADMRRPSVHEIFRVPNVAGLGAALSAEGDRKLSLVEVSEHLTVLPAGRPDPNPLGGLTSDRMRRILSEASAKFDWVVLDTPPIGLLSDANILAEMADTVVLVIGAGTTPFKPVQRAVDAIGRNRIAGVVLNRVTTHDPAYSYYAHYHYVQHQEANAANGS